MLDVGTDKQSFGYGGTGKKSHARQFDDYGQAYGESLKGVLLGGRGGARVVTGGLGFFVARQLVGMEFRGQGVDGHGVDS